MLHTYMQLQQELKAFICQSSSTDEQFNTIALKLFQFQYEYNQPYRKFCRKRRVSPRTIKHFTEIPPVPIDAFKLTTLSSFPIEETSAVFMTSGTTNQDRRGKNYHHDLELYDLSMKTHFKSFMMPDLDNMKMFILFPTQDEMPNSSLAHYLHIAKETFGTSDSKYAFTNEGFQIKTLIDDLQFAEEKGEPIMLIGATFSFIHLLDECKKNNIQFKLPPNSRIMDTGGAKGRSREIEPTEFKEEISELCEVPLEMCVNMYGMTELSSQIYDRNLFDYFHQNEIHTTKVSPHWVKTVIMDLEEMREQPLGEKGLIVHYDLANINSVSSILTEDIGVQGDGGFSLLGRAKGAEAKGCSLAVEQFMASSQNAKGAL
ncbi:long-chain fatty acid--CoA ligase [Anaerobacillus alkalilacustris]|nr:long-chain fatty acid--CoA ligase [Anaerobacillus alkalilacustris]